MKIFLQSNETFQYLQEQNLVANIRFCPKCRLMMTPCFDKDTYYRWRCKKCRKSIAARDKTIFANSKLPFTSVMLVLLCFWLSVRQIQTTYLSGVERHIVSKWFTRGRRAMATDEYFTKIKLGGENRIVEIDEAVFRKRKYHKGRPKPVIWILGMAERAVHGHDKCRVFYKVLKDRSANTILPIIKDHVIPGTLIMTDEWRSYHRIPGIEGMNYKHQTVCHSRTYVDEVTGAYTNTVEGMWAHLRRWLPQNGVRKRFISEFLWCFVYKHNRNCTFEDFLTSLRIFSPEKFTEFVFELQEQEEDVQGVPDHHEEGDEPVDSGIGDPSEHTFDFEVPVEPEHESSETL
jgi:transposase-like protein